MMNFGWKKKIERLRMVIVSTAHPLAKELPPGLSEILAAFGRVAASGDASDLQQEIARIRGQLIDPNEILPLWEPEAVYGWRIQATMYLRDGELWWLVHAARANERTPSETEISLLNKVLEHLGCQPKRHAIIAPTSSPPGEPPLPFGWWTWQNRSPLYEVQVNPNKKSDREKIRIVPLGSRASDGYEPLPIDRA